jgi:hypothetical protein
VHYSDLRQQIQLYWSYNNNNNNHNNKNNLIKTAGSRQVPGRKGL